MRPRLTERLPSIDAPLPLPWLMQRLGPLWRYEFQYQMALPMVSLIGTLALVHLITVSVEEMGDRQTRTRSEAPRGLACAQTTALFDFYVRTGRIGTHTSTRRMDWVTNNDFRVRLPLLGLSSEKRTQKQGRTGAAKERAVHPSARLLRLPCALLYSWVW